MCSKVVLGLWIAGAAQADQFSVMLSSNYPTAYSFYSFTAADGSAQNNIPVAPYPISISDTGGVYNNTSAYAICLDYNNPSYVGQTYTGQLVVNTNLASMETSYLTNMLNLDGLAAASTTIKGEISFAIWQIMFPSSTQTDGSYFPVDNASAALELQAYSAVTSGTWTAADNSLYPTFEPTDTTSQRYAVILPGTAPVETLMGGSEQGSAPEPGTVVLMGGGFAWLAIRKRRG